MILAENGLKKEPDFRDVLRIEMIQLVTEQVGIYRKKGSWMGTR
jgi:hypothetical protein